MGRRVLRVRNALTGAVREVVLPRSSVVEKRAAERVSVKDVKVELKADVSDFTGAIAKGARAGVLNAIEKGARDGADNG